MNALLALLAEDYTDDKGLDFIEIILIGSVVVGIPLIIFSIWVSKSDSPWAVKQRESNAEFRASQQYFDDDDDDRDYELEREMKQYYMNKNFDRQQGRD